jgi:hypothetical protein
MERAQRRLALLRVPLSRTGILREPTQVDFRSMATRACDGHFVTDAMLNVRIDVNA